MKNRDEWKIDKDPQNDHPLKTCSHSSIELGLLSNEENKLPVTQHIEKKYDLRKQSPEVVEGAWS